MTLDDLENALDAEGLDFRAARSASDGAWRVELVERASGVVVQRGVDRQHLVFAVTDAFAAYLERQGRGRHVVARKHRA